MRRVHSSLDTFEPGKSFGTKNVLHERNALFISLLSRHFCRGLRTRLGPVGLERTQKVTLIVIEFRTTWLVICRSSIHHYSIEEWFATNREPQVRP